MERRTCARKTVEVSVYLSDSKRRVSRGTATDISASGIFLKTNPLFVPRHKRLNLMFALRNNSSNLVRLRQITAVVIRAERDGVGMRFCATGKYNKARAAGS